MSTFRIDVGNLYYLLLDAPTKEIAQRWSRQIPEPKSIVSIRVASQDERLDYVISGFEVRNFSESFQQKG